MTWTICGVQSQISRSLVAIVAGLEHGAQGSKSPSRWPSPTWQSPNLARSSFNKWFRLVASGI